MDEAKSLLTFRENAKRYDIIPCEVLPKKTEHFPIESIIGQTDNIFTDASLRQFGSRISGGRAILQHLPSVSKTTFATDLSFVLLYLPHVYAALIRL